MVKKTINKRCNFLIITKEVLTISESKTHKLKLMFRKMSIQILFMDIRLKYVLKYSLQDDDFLLEINKKK